MKNLTWQEKSAIFEEVKHIYDVQDAKIWATNIGLSLTDEEAEAAASLYDKEYSSGFAAYDQMMDAVRAVTGTK